MHPSGDRRAAASSNRRSDANLVARTLRGLTQPSRGREQLFELVRASMQRRWFGRFGTHVLTVLCDTSVVIKWFVSTNEDDVTAANKLLVAHRDGRAALRVISLVREELANALLRGRAQTAAATHAVLAALEELVPVAHPTGPERSHAIDLADAHRLTVHDATFAAVASVRGWTPVTADCQLLVSGLGVDLETAAAYVEAA